MNTSLTIMSIMFNVASVFFATRNDKITWIYGITASLSTIVLFANANLLFSVGFQIISIILCIVGLAKWKYKNEDNEKKLNLSNVPLYLIFLCLFLIFIIFHFPNNTNKIIIDMCLSGMSIFATYLLTQQNLLNWVFWIAIDICYVFLGVMVKDASIIVLYMVLFGLAFHGLLRNYWIFKKQNGDKLIFS